MSDTHRTAPLATLIDDRRDNFNAIRLLSAFAIIVSHYFALRDGSNVREPFQVLSGVCNIGKVVTYLCFVVSGMAVTRSYLRKPSAADFVVRRLLRLLPALIACVIVCIGMGLALTSLKSATFVKSRETMKFAANAVMYPNHYGLPGVFTQYAEGDPRNAVNGSLWVFAPLFLVYLSVPALGAMKLLRAPALIVIAAMCLIAWEASEIHGIAQTSRLAKYAVWIEFVPHLGFFFFCGAAAATAKQKPPVNFAGFAVAILVMGAVFALRHFAPSRAMDHASYTVVTLTLAYIAVYLSFVKSAGLAALNGAGVIAYGVYLYGYPVQQLLMQLAGKTLPGIVQILMACGVCAFVAIASWFAIEKPFARCRA